MTGVHQCREFEPRLFRSDAEIQHLGEGVLARTLPREEWTHDAHLTATTYFLLKRPDVDLDKQLPNIIRKYNASVGGVTATAKAITRRSPTYSSEACAYSWPKQT